VTGSSAGAAAPQRLDAATPAARASAAQAPADRTSIERIVVDGRGIAVRRGFGPAGGQPALYVHGLGGSSTNWVDAGVLLGDALDGEAIDLPGFGESDPPADGDYRLRRLADIVAHVIEARGRGPVHMAGNSLGGAVAAQLAAGRPELVRTLTLVAPAMPDLRPRNRIRALLAASAVPGVPRVAEWHLVGAPIESSQLRVRRVIDSVFGDPAVISPDRLADAIGEAERRASLPWADEAFARSLRGLLAAHLRVGRSSLWAVLPRIRARTLVVWGGADLLVPVELAARTAAAVPDARLMVLPGVGHTPQIEAPGEVAAAMRDLLGAPLSSTG